MLIAIDLSCNRLSICRLVEHSSLCHIVIVLSICIKSRKISNLFFGYILSVQAPIYTSNSVGLCKFFCLLFKKLDILITRSFIGPFIVTFFVMLFVLAMQFFWLYMDELIGKGFGVLLILQLLLYMSATLVPLALPLAVLLASIMTFGSMGENYELVAIKAAGNSLLRIMRPLFVVMIIISGMAFFFSNNVIPVANLKAYTLLYDLRNSKLTLSIREGQFNTEINGYAIRVGSKSEDGKTIKNIIIYDNSGGAGNDKLVLADDGEMIPSPDKRYLIFRLRNGWRYEESINGKGGTNSYSQIRMKFKQYDKIFDMSSFTKVQKTDENTMRGGQTMMNISQLNANIDSAKRNKPREAKRFDDELKNFISIRAAYADDLLKGIAKAQDRRDYEGSFLASVPDSLRRQVLEIAESQARSTKLYTDVTAKTFEVYSDQMTGYLIEWHRKFSLSFACLLLYLIGAPLGAIIRKGGIGLPLIIAVIFFVAYFITSKTGEALSSSKKLPPYFGMWLSSLMLLPFAFFFIRQARNDSKLFSKEWYVSNMNRFVRFLKKDK
jgi:lipopolysaccharide export system permease protein